MGNLSLVNQLTLTLGGKQTLIFQGDIFDHIIHNSKWLAKFGAASYGLLSMVNNLVNKLRRFIGLRPVLIYKGIKQRLLPDTKVLNNFEKMVVAAAQTRNFAFGEIKKNKPQRHEEMIPQEGSENTKTFVPFVVA